MKRDLSSLSDYRVIVCDMDGTLYFQPPVRALMALELLVYYGLRPWRFKEPLMLRFFRKLRESEALTVSRNFAGEQWRMVAQKYHVAPEQVRMLAEQWMQRRPLKWLRLFRDRKLIGKLNDCQRQGAKIAVFSDYPAADKTRAIGLAADGVFCSSDADIGELKPSAKGLAVIAEKMSCRKDEMLMIGDRYEKDGRCAENFSIDFVILPSGWFSRDCGD